MPLNWPSMAEDACQNFNMLAVFGEVKPGVVSVTHQPVAAHKFQMTAAGPEEGTFIRVQPLFYQDNQLALTLQMSRSSYYEGNVPSELASLAEVLRRAESFIGQACQVQMTGEYFLPVSDTPRLLQMARGPFGVDAPTFTNLAGLCAVKDSLVQQIHWVFREDGQWKLTLSGTQKRTLSTECVCEVKVEFDRIFRDFKNARVYRD